MDPLTPDGSGEVLLSRRTVLRFAALGLAGITLATHPSARALGAMHLTVIDPEATVRLAIRECLQEMVDERRVYAWAFESEDVGLRIPGPLLVAEEGQLVGLEVTNHLPRPHGFGIPGVVDSGPIAPGESRAVTFTAPAAGTYIYLDPMGAPMHRLMGLAGVLVVLPTTGSTPYSAPTQTVQHLFDDLGETDHFPGHRWLRQRTWIWVFATVDPIANARVAEDPDLDPVSYLADYHPRYFTLNGRSGFFASHDPATALNGQVGQPALIRVANVGSAIHSPHIHGNHVYVLAENGSIHHNLPAHDTWEMLPLATADVLHPFIRPPDAHPWPPTDPTVWTRDLGGDGTTGMVFPMHCHAELSQLANGANYPQGLITHWALTGDLIEGEEPPEDPEDPPPDPEDPPPDPEDPPTGPGKGKGKGGGTGGGKPPKPPKPPKG